MTRYLLSSNLEMNFRPRIGNYFFIFMLLMLGMSSHQGAWFPSPYWGLFFYRRKRIWGRVGTSWHLSVPALEIIFLSQMTRYEYVQMLYKFPSPYCGLFFIWSWLQRKKLPDYLSVSVPILRVIFLSVDAEILIEARLDFSFPSPYWGLFFYQTSHTAIIGLNS